MGTGPEEIGVPVASFGAPGEPPEIAAGSAGWHWRNNGPRDP